MFQRVYHITHRCHRDSILAEGLMPQGHQSEHCRWRGFGYPPRIFVSTMGCDPYAFDYVGHEGVDVWTFVVWKGQLQKDTRSSSKQHYFINRPVPAASLRLFRSFGYWS